MQFTALFWLRAVSPLHSLWARASRSVPGQEPLGKVPLRCDSDCEVGLSDDEDWGLLDKWLEPDFPFGLERGAQMPVGPVVCQALSSTQLHALRCQIKCSSH